MTFTKREQELLIKMFLDEKFSITANGQKIYNSKWFFDIVSKLKKDGIIISERIGNKTSYRLTEEGIILSYILSKRIGNSKEVWYSIFFYV